MTNDKLAESPTWEDTSSSLYWVDFYGPTVHRLHVPTNRLESWTIGEAKSIGSLVLASSGRLLLALDTGLKLFDPSSGTLRHFADPNAGRAGISYNDAKVDRWGRYWIGSFDIAEMEPRGILYGIDAEGGIAVGDSGFVVCNGPAFSPDGHTLYFSDSVGRRLIAYSCDPGSMALRERREFVRFSDNDGIPDGLTVDREGNLWCALYGGGKVVCISQQGGTLRELRLPGSAVTSCCFGGAELSTLYVTIGQDPNESDAHRGSVFAIDAGARGIAERVFICGTIS